MTPDVLTVLLAATVGMGAIVGIFVAMASERRIEPRRAVRPPVDGARVAGPGAVPPPRSLLRVVEAQEQDPRRTPRLVSPYLAAYMKRISDAPVTAPTALPQVRQINGARVALVETTCICRGGRSVGPLGRCVWCKTPRVDEP